MNNKALAGVMAFAIIAVSGAVAYKTFPGVVKVSPSASYQTNLEPEQPDLPLVGTEWIWLQNEKLNGDLVSTPDREKFVLTFTPDGKMESSTDCNVFFGTYTEKPVFHFSALGSTKKACPTTSFEGVYSQSLGKAQGYEIIGNRLTLTLSNKGGTMVFEKR